MQTQINKDVELYLSSCAKDKLARIDLRHCKINCYNPEYAYNGRPFYPRFIKLLVSALDHAMEVHLQYNNLSSQFAMTLLQDIANQLSQGNQSVSIMLAYNYLGNAAAFFIGQLMSEHSQLVKVDVSNNQIGKRGLIMMVSQAITSKAPNIQLTFEANPASPPLLEFLSKVIEVRNQIVIDDEDIKISECLALICQFRDHTKMEAFSYVREFISVIDIVNELQFESALDYQTMLRYAVVTYVVTAEADDLLALRLKNYLSTD